jgi:hypothetical protein
MGNEEESKKDEQGSVFTWKASRELTLSIAAFVCFILLMMCVGAAGLLSIFMLDGEPTPHVPHQHDLGCEEGDCP